METLKERLSDFIPVDSLSGTYTISSITSGNSNKNLITFDPAFGSIPTVIAVVTSNHKYTNVIVS